MGVQRISRPRQTHVCQKPSICAPDNGLGLKSGLTLRVDYRAATSLRLRFARTVKNLIHHLDRRDLRPNKVGLPRR
jgi:hypothetical protein